MINVSLHRRSRQSRSQSLSSYMLSKQINAINPAFICFNRLLAKEGMWKSGPGNILRLFNNSCCKMEMNQAGRERSIYIVNERIVRISSLWIFFFFSKKINKLRYKYFSLHGHQFVYKNTLPKGYV